MTRVLIVDDKPENLGRLRALLEGHGCDVEDARHGAEALTRARQHPPDLVIADLLMPVMDGYTLLRLWKADARLNAIPFIVYTATCAEPKDQQLVLDLGADAFILKPVEPEPFMARLHVVLAQPARAELPPSRQPVGEEEGRLTTYSDVLVRRLEEKALQLEQANRDLVARETRLRAILDAEPECVKLLAADGSLLEMNPAGLRMLEADSFHEVENQCLYPFVVDEYRQAFRALTARVFRGESGVLEFEAVGLKGGRRWLETHAAPSRDATGAVTALLGITRDITEHKLADAIVACQTNVLERIATGAPLADTLTAMLQHIEGLMPGMQCSVLLLDTDGTRLRHCAAPRLPDAYNRAVDGLLIGPRAGSCGTAAFRREAVIVEDIATDPLWAEWRELAMAHGLRACWSTPIRDAQQRVQGTFAIYYREPGRPTEWHRRCIDLATHLAAVAISRQRAETALRESEAKFRAICEASPVGIFLIRPDGHVTYGNPANLRLTGLSWEDTMGLNWVKAIHPDDRAQVMAEWQGCQAARRPYAGSGRYLHADGTIVWWDVTTAPIYDGGTLLGSVGLVVDSTARKQAEETLKQNHERLEAAERRANLGSWERDVRSGHGWWSAHMFTMMGRDPAQGVPTMEAALSSIHPEDRQLLQEVLIRALQGQEPAVREFRSNPERGPLRYFSLTGSAERNLEGEATKIGGTLLDTTERKQAEDVLRQAHDRLRELSRRLLEIQETERRELARELHDEIGQVLTAAKINLQSLLRFPDPAAIASRLDESVGIIDRALQQVRSLSLDLRPPMLDDLGLVAALRWLADQHAKRAGLHLRFDACPADARFDAAVETACFRVAQEALNNIAKHAGARNVVVDLQERDNQLHLRVRDDGAGFDVAAARRRAVHGVSLGLLGMEERASLVGGGVEWRSTLGQGADVHAWFPLHQPMTLTGETPATA